MLEENLEPLVKVNEAKVDLIQITFIPNKLFFQNRYLKYALTTKTKTGSKNNCFPRSKIKTNYFFFLAKPIILHITKHRAPLTVFFAQNLGDFKPTPTTR